MRNAPAGNILTPSAAQSAYLSRIGFAIVVAGAATIAQGQCISAERTSGLWVNYENKCASYGTIWQTCGDGRETRTPIPPCSKTQTMCDKKYTLEWHANVEDESLVCTNKQDYAPRK